MPIDDIRSRLTATSNRRVVREHIQLAGAGEPIEVGVAQASLAARAKILGILDGKASASAMTDAKVSSVVECVVDPETGERIFSARDRDLLLAQPAGDWFDRISDLAIRLMNGASDARCAAAGEGGLPCNAQLLPAARYCHACGAAAPSAIEAAKKN